MIINESIKEIMAHVVGLEPIINISGEAGTGKSTLAIHLIGHYLTRKRPFKGSCIWMQASKLFSKKRLSQMFGNDPEKLNYLTSHVYATPKGRTFQSLSEQMQYFRHFTEEEMVLPPDVKCVVIDNISHHLRGEVLNACDVKEVRALQDNFYGDHLLDLLFFCVVEGITVILIHEVSFVPSAGGNLPFFYKLYSRIHSASIFLSHQHESSEKTMKFISRNEKWAFKYSLTKEGVEWHKC